MCAGCTRLPAPTCRGKCCTGHTHTWWPALHSLSQDTGSVPHTYIHLHCRTQVAYINTSFILEHRCVSFLNAGCMHMHLHSQVGGVHTPTCTQAVCAEFTWTQVAHIPPPPFLNSWTKVAKPHTHSSYICKHTLWHKKKCILDHTGCTHTNYSWSNVPRNIYI